MARKPPRLYFNLRSPFSWMGLRRLEERYPAARETIEYIPYWDPDQQTVDALTERGAGYHYVQMSKAKHLYILQDTKRLVTRFGYKMVWPVDVDPWWELPHLGWIKAHHLGQSGRYYDAVTTARWEHGHNICDEDVLRRVLADAGLDPDPLVTAAHDPAIRAQGVDAMARAWDDDVFGIPYFKVGPHRFWGLDRVDDYLAALPGTTPAPDTTDIPPPLLATVGATDHDTAGGCG